MEEFNKKQQGQQTNSQANNTRSIDGMIYKPVSQNQQVMTSESVSMQNQNNINSNSNFNFNKSARLDKNTAPAIGNNLQDDNYSKNGKASNNVKKKSKIKAIFKILLILLILLIVGSVVFYFWYNKQLEPKDKSSKALSTISINSGESFYAIADGMQERGLIKSSLALKIYGKITGKSNLIKQGDCSFSPADEPEDMVERMIKGCYDFKKITFYPGATIDKPLYKPDGSVLDQDSMYIKGVLKKAGYSDAEIEAALAKKYDSPLFADKPEGTSLEGYIFGETYHVAKEFTAEQVLQESFKQMYNVIKENDLEEMYKKQGLNLYQGITLASIIQRELDCESKTTPDSQNKCYNYQRTIAQIFLKRLREDMPLGSDVTFIYAADKMKVKPTVDIDSPYNTRINKGLTPGPIASPGRLALMAVGDPTDTDYVYFIAGDDGLIYFAKDNAGHEDNIRRYCQKLCGEL